MRASSISVVVGTFGGPEWQDLAARRAIPSVGGALEVIPVHADTLARARNSGAEWAAGRWLVFLDADDELAPGYLTAMEQAVAAHGNRSRLYTPQVQYIFGRKEYAPRFMPEVPVENGNWLVIGTMVPRDVFLEVGGFEEWPLYEDWALFARMQKAGVPVAKVPAAVYRAFRSSRSRNHPVGGRRVKLAAHDAIRRAVFPELYEEVP